MAQQGTTVNAQSFGKAVALTKSDATIFSPTDGVWVGDGNATMAVRMADGSTVTFSAIPDGTFLPIRITQLRSSGTDAANVVALYF